MMLTDADMLTIESEQRERGLRELVDRMMQGEEYPKRPTRRQINLLDILCEQEPETLARAIHRTIGDPTTYELDNAVRKLVADYLRDGEFHEMMFQQIREEDEAGR